MEDKNEDKLKNKIKDKENIKYYQKIADFRPLPFLAGVGIGTLDAVVHPQGEGLSKLITQNPSILQFGIFGGLITTISYFDKVNTWRTKQEIISDVGITLGNYTLGNYTLGYTLGYSFSRLFQ
jgi:hypothetical protein